MLSTIRRSLNCLSVRIPYSIGVTGARTVTPMMRNRLFSPCLHSLTPIKLIAGRVAVRRRCVLGISLAGAITPLWGDPSLNRTQQLHEALNPVHPDFELATKLIEDGIDAGDEFAQAATQNSIAIVKFLISKGIPTPSRTLLEVLRNGSLEMLDLLLNRELELVPSVKSLLTVLTRLDANEKNTKQIEYFMTYLINHYPEAEIRGKVFHQACSMKMLTVVKEILKTETNFSLSTLESIVRECEKLFDELMPLLEIDQLNQHALEQYLCGDARRDWCENINQPYIINEREINEFHEKIVAPLLSNYEFYVNLLKLYHFYSYSDANGSTKESYMERKERIGKCLIILDNHKKICA